MTKKCSNLTEGTTVIFKIYSDIYKEKKCEIGTVLSVYPEAKKSMCGLFGGLEKLN